MKHAQCGKITPHQKHTWRDGWFFMFRRICNGVISRDSIDPWVRANPSLGHQIDACVVRKMLEPSTSHRHYYLVKNNVLVTPRGFPVSRDNVYWQCADPFCADIIQMPRDEVRKALSKKPIYQTWPG